MKPEHAPLPWHTMLYESEEGLVGGIGDADGALVAYATPVNAHFIVRAVNTHEELLAFVRSAPCGPNCLAYHEPGQCTCGRYQLISKAEGK